MSPVEPYPALNLLDKDISHFGDNLDVAHSAIWDGHSTSPATSTCSTGSTNPITFSDPPQTPTCELSRVQFNSSPCLVSVHRPAHISRTDTLPFATEVAHPRVYQNEVDALSIDLRDIAQIHRWILGIVMVEFDIDRGPVVDCIFPPLFLAPSEKENIAFSAFPDSLQFEQGSQSHSFRIREQISLYPREKRPLSHDGFIYGFSHFTQRRDATSKRGYQQRSLVVLTQFPYPALFSEIASIFGPLFHEHGIAMFEAAAHNMATWRDPIPGMTMELGFLGTVINVQIPHSIDEQQLTETSAFAEKYNPTRHILASTPPLLPSPLLLFEASLSHLWSIWECLVLCEPILVFGSSPTQTSQTVWWLRDILRPIPLAGDLRPYFTMQDGDLSLLINKLPPKAGTLLGVTNPYFAKSCAHWPHILSVGRLIRHRSDPSSKASQVHAAGPSPGWKTKTHKRYISKDRNLLKQLEIDLRGEGRDVIAASLALRQHFCARTTQIIVPLARYLNTLIPKPSEVATARSTRTSGLRLKPFNSTHFFTSLKTHGSTLPFKSTGKRTEFYERWLRSPAFGLWLARQEDIVQGVLDQSVVQGSGTA